MSRREQELEISEKYALIKFFGLGLFFLDGERIHLQDGETCIEFVDCRSGVLDSWFDPQHLSNLPKIEWPCPNAAEERADSFPYGKPAVFGGRVLQPTRCGRPYDLGMVSNNDQYFCYVIHMSTPS